MHSCIVWLYTVFDRFTRTYDITIEKLKLFRQISKSTDIVGFFNFVIESFFINNKIDKYVYFLYHELLLLTKHYMFDDILKMLSFLSIVSVDRRPYRILIEIPYCKKVIEDIERRLYQHIEGIELLFDQPITDENRGILSYIHFIYKQFELPAINKKFFMFLYKLGTYCLNSNFDLEDFNCQYPTIFDLNLFT